MKIDSSASDVDVDDGEKKRDKMAVKENSDEMAGDIANQEEESGAGGDIKKKAVENNQEIPPILLFEKTLESEDSNSVLNRLVVGRCKELMMTTLQNAEEAKKCDYVRVMTKDPEGVEYELRFMRYVPKGKYVLTHKWGDLVAANGLGKGDIIVGWGNLVGDAFFVMLRFLRRSQQIIDVVCLPSSDSST